MNRRQFFFGGNIAIIAATAGALLANWQTRISSASAEAVKALFEREWFSPDQKPISTADWKNKVLVVNFWASWCPPCIEEMPALDKVQSEYDTEKKLTTVHGAPWLKSSHAYTYLGHLRNLHGWDSGNCSASRSSGDRLRHQRLSSHEHSA